jgi:hypothetical protein
VKRFELTLDIEALLDEADKDNSGYIDDEEVRFLLRIAAVDEAILFPPELVLRLFQRGIPVGMHRDLVSTVTCFCSGWTIVSQILLQLLQRQYPTP